VPSESKLSVMIKNAWLILLAVCSIDFCSMQSPAQVAAQEATRQAVSVELEQALSWLPADTETITVARGPLVLAANPGRNEAQNRTVSDQELAQYFEDLPLALFQFKDGLLSTRLKGKQIVLALEGARHFRPPADLGEMPYEGCAVAVFADDLDDNMRSFFRETRSIALRVEQVRDQQIPVFQEKLERDTWTAFVAFPNKHVVLVATNLDYITEVLARLQGKKGERALPGDLAEWKYVDTEARFWGLRHFDRSQTKMDPSSPFGGRKSANFPDDQAIGLTFVFDPSRGRSATITYLSGDNSMPKRANASLLGMGQAREARDLDIKYRELAPGVAQGSYSLERMEPIQFFLFILDGILGHAIYL
jgi:hypothetical protein